MFIKELLLELDQKDNQQDHQKDSQTGNQKQSEPLEQETGGFTVNNQVKKLQQTLLQLGYDLGPPGVDGKYGPYTASAVKSFKNDYKIPGSGRSVGNKTLSVLKGIKSGSIEKVETTKSEPAKVKSKGFEGDNKLITIPELSKAKETAESFLGSAISDKEFSMLFRAVMAEASSNSGERAGVMAVMLNRVRSGRYPNSIEGVLTQRNQFQAVTGTRANKHRPSPHYSKTPSERNTKKLADAIISGLPSANRSWLNFTSAVAGAYGAGTNIGFMKKVADSKGSRKIGKTWFGTV